MPNQPEEKLKDLTEVIDGAQLQLRLQNLNRSIDTMADTGQVSQTELVYILDIVASLLSKLAEPRIIHA